MSTAHIFYIPVMLLVGAFAGYFLGRSAAEQEMKERTKLLAKRRKRDQAQLADGDEEPAQASSEDLP